MNLYPISLPFSFQKPNKRLEGSEYDLDRILLATPTLRPSSSCHSCFYPDARQGVAARSIAGQRLPAEKQPAACTAPDDRNGPKRHPCRFRSAAVCLHFDIIMRQVLSKRLPCSMAKALVPTMARTEHVFHRPDNPEGATHQS